MTKSEKLLLTVAAVATATLITLGLSSCNPAANKTGAVTVSSVARAQGSTDGNDTVVPSPSLPSEVVNKVELKTKKIKNVTLPEGRVITIFGEVSSNALAAAEKVQLLNQMSSEPIYIVLESPGGSVLTGAQLISAMQASKAPIYTVCRTLCASMAFMILEYGTKRYATDRTLLMAHPASAGTSGQVDNMASFVNSLKRYTNKMEAEVAARMGITFELYKAKTANEYWVDAEDGLRDNAIDGIVSISSDVSTINLGNQGSENVKRSLGYDLPWIKK